MKSQTQIMQVVFMTSFSITYWCFFFRFWLLVHRGAGGLNGNLGTIVGYIVAFKTEK